MTARSIPCLCRHRSTATHPYDHRALLTAPPMQTSIESFPGSLDQPGRKRDQLQLQLAAGRHPRGKPPWAHHPGCLHLVAQHQRRSQRSQRALQPVQRELRSTDRTRGFDRRHIFNVSYVYALPWFTKSSNLSAREVLGGWAISGITAAESGAAAVHHLYRPRRSRSGLLASPTVRTRWHQSRYPKKVGAWFSTEFVCRSGRSVGRRTESGLRQRWKRLGCGAWASSTGISRCSRPFHSPRTKDRGSNCASSPSIPSTTLNPKGVDTNYHDGNFGAVTNDYGPAYAAARRQVHLLICASPLPGAAEFVLPRPFFFSQHRDASGCAQCRASDNAKGDVSEADCATAMFSA